MSEPARSDPPSTTSASPVRGTERIGSLDVLRGFAVLGILVMNVQSFSMIGAAYFNPNVSGYFDGIDRWIWIVGHLFTDQKFMTLFSMLFGAGIVLMAGRSDASGRQAAGLHYRRMIWLLLIGAAHAYLFWYGDVLVWYALSGLVVFLLRKRRPRTLLTIGLISLLIGAGLYLATGIAITSMPEDVVQENFSSNWQPSQEDIDAEVAAYRGGFAEQMTLRAPTAFGMHTFVFLFFAFWRAGGLMLVGMAYFKWSLFDATRPAAFYRKLAIRGLALGLPIVALGIYTNMRAGWTVGYSQFFGVFPNYIGSVLVSTGYVGLIMLWCQGSLLQGLRARLAAVGRMALTNYLTQTLICTSLFYGHGLGWFQGADRVQQSLVVIAVWALQLIWSPIWLRHFRFGPFEWLWRSLTYFRPQPMQR